MARVKESMDQEFFLTDEAAIMSPAQGEDRKNIFVGWGSNGLVIHDTQKTQVHILSIII